MIVRVIGITRDCGPIDLTIDVGDETLSDEVAIVFAMGALAALGYESEEFVSVMLDGRPVVPGAPTSVEEAADAAGIELDGGSGGFFRWRLDGMHGILWAARDDDEGEAES